MSQYQTNDYHNELTESMGLVLTQEFFSNMQHNFTVPLLKKIAGTKLGNFPRVQADLGMMKLDMNLTNIQLYNISVSDSNEQVQLLDEYAILETQDFTLNISCDYSYISDPPIFADFGTLYFLINDWDTIINGTTSYPNDTIQFDVYKLESTIGKFDFEFDGISDLSIILTNIVGSLVDFISSKVASLLGSQLQTKLVPLINILIEMIPGDIQIPNTDLYIQWGFQNSIHIEKDSYMRIPLSFSLQSKKSYYDGTSEKKLPLYIDNGFQIESFISQYTANSIAYALHTEDLIKFKTKYFTTEFIGKLVGNQLFKFFDHNMTCEITFDTVGPFPNIQITPNFTELFANMTADIQCQKHADDPQLYPVVTLVLTTDIKSLITIDNNLTVKGNILKLDATVASYFNSTIGDISLYFLQIEIAAAERIIVGVINAVINQGYSLYWIITDVLKITFVDFRQINLINGDGYMQFQATPLFNITKAEEQIQKFLLQDNILVKIDNDIIIDKYGKTLDNLIVHQYNQIISQI